MNAAVGFLARFIQREQEEAWDWERLETLVTVVLLIVAVIFAVVARHVLGPALSSTWHALCHSLLLWGINITGQPWHPSGQPWPPSVGQ